MAMLSDPAPRGVLQPRMPRVASSQSEVAKYKVCIGKKAGLLAKVVNFLYILPLEFMQSYLDI